MGKHTKTAVTACAMMMTVVLLFLLAEAIYAHSTPKVYVVPAGKGLINGEVYDCVIPKAAITEDETVWVVTRVQRAVGIRYHVTEQNVFIEAEDGSMCAVKISGNVMVVLAHDGRMCTKGDVLIYRS